MASKKNKQAQQAEAAQDTPQTETQQAATATAAPPQPKQNGITRPKSGTATGRVWEISDTISKDKGAPAPRGEVMAAGKAEGLNEATIATQYGRWRKFHGLKTERAVAAAQPAAAPADAAEVETDEDSETEE